MSDAPRFALGIDLGTTNCALSFAPLDDASATPDAMGVPQVVAPGEVSPRRLLPSFLFFPAEGQFPKGALGLPWVPSARDVAGVFAREQSATTPTRLVASAKSWLSHVGVDRREEILPWDAPEGISKVSPLQASARYLAHLRAAWEEQHPEQPLAEQDVVLTVPASFDAVARELTLEAAALAGFDTPPRLLEEPQAALYDWVSQHGATWRDAVSVGDTILVVDIGGGTTDFSLIAVSEEDGSLQLERVAVGDHILLGGDNMDLALAYGVKAQLEAEGKNLDDWQMRALAHGCRRAKEALLGDDPPDAFPLAVPGRGSKLIGGTIRTELSREQVHQIVLDGFFPSVAADARPAAARRLALTTVGLPYASDAGMTRHLAAFLARSAPEGSAPVRPSAVLFNGGVSRAGAVRGRILEVLERWFGQPPAVLEGTDPEIAVSRGAAYYAHARRHKGLRIRGGTGRAYYVGLERAELAVPGIPPKVDAVCVAPLGMEEGSEAELDQTFGLILGEPVSFQFFSSTSRREDAVGSITTPGSLHELAPIETELEGQDGQVVHVRLRARVTEIGTLELSCVEQGVAEAEARRWKLSFNIRG